MLSSDYRINYLSHLCLQNRRLFDSSYVWYFDSVELPLNPRNLFAQCRRTFLEIGFGHGEVLEELVARFPDTGFIGIERRPGRVRKALKRLHRVGQPNIRLIRANLELIDVPLFAMESFDEVLINHPDPWPKRRHERHRFFNPETLNWLASLLRSQGIIEVASDQADYFFSILRLFEADKRFFGLLPPPHYSSDPLPGRPQSRFEKHKRAAGETVRILRFQKV